MKTLPCPKLRLWAVRSLGYPRILPEFTALLNGSGKIENPRNTLNMKYVFAISTTEAITCKRNTLVHKFIVMKINTISFCGES